MLRAGWGFAKAEVKAGWKIAKEAIAKSAAAVKNFAASKLSALRKVGADLFKGAKNGISKGVQSVSDTFSKWFGHAAERGATFEGSIYRAPYPGTSPTVIDKHNVEANHRYSAPDEGALYFSTNPRTVIQELGGSFTGGRTMDTFNVRIQNLLDLSNPATRSRLGVSLEDIVRTTGADKYNITHELGRYARAQGYNGIIAPSARSDAGLNLIHSRPTGIEVRGGSWPRVCRSR